MLLQPPGAPTEAVLHCISICSTRHRQQGPQQGRLGIIRSWDKPAFEAEGQPHSIKAQQPETVHDCGKVQGNGIVAP